MTNYRLALDVGTNSLGWAVLDLSDQSAVVNVRRIGVRIFNDSRDPKSKASLAVERRLARQARRRRDRYLRRRDRLMRKLTEYGLFPKQVGARKQLESLNPYELRHQGLSEELTLGALARAIFHLNQRRGFQSNRVSDPSSDEDEGLIKGAISKTREAMLEGGFATVGSYLNALRIQGKPTRARRGGEANEYELYVDRSMIAEEFDALMASQRAFHPDALTDEVIADLRDTLLFQRPLRPVKPGWCTFLSGEPRAALALPLVQHFRILQELNNLRVVGDDFSERSLTLEERDALFNELEISDKLTFAKIRKAIGCSRHERLNLELGGRKHLLGNSTAFVLSDDACLGNLWFQLDAATQNKLVTALLDARDNEALAEHLRESYDFSEHQINSLVSLRLQDGYGNLSAAALERIVPHLREAVVTYDKAALAAGFDHSVLGQEELKEELPYYGAVLERYCAGQTGSEDDDEQSRYGRIANPTVHRSLNQVRKVVNEIISKFGKPTEVVIEVTRELKLSERQKKEINKTNRDNEKKNQEHADQLSSLGISNNYQNRLRLKLWENLNTEEPLNRCCPYTGMQISISKLFSPEIEIDHIIPFSRSLDDSVSNKVLCSRDSNRQKGDMTPYEAFGDSENWEDILIRASKLPPASARRFSKESGTQTREDFLARQLTDTAYIARVSREYMASIVPNQRIWSVPGRLTAMLRQGWELNSVIGNEDFKDRDDHRHHAIDAVVVGCTDRATLNKVSRAAGLERAHRVTDYVKPPFEGLRQRVIELIGKTLVSYKPEHGIRGELHNATALGLASEPDESGVRTVVTRKMLADLAPNQLTNIRDSKIREGVIAATSGLNGADFKRALSTFGKQNNIRRVRIIDRVNVRVVSDREGVPYKGFRPDGNHCVEIVVREDGNWTGELVTTWDANSERHRSFRSAKDYFRKSFSGHDLAMRLFKHDLVKVDDEGRAQILVIRGFSAGKITLAPIEASNPDPRSGDGPFKQITKSADKLRQMKARKVFITPAGSLREPLS